MATCWGNSAGDVSTNPYEYITADQIGPWYTGTSTGAAEQMAQQQRKAYEELAGRLGVPPYSPPRELTLEDVVAQEVRKLKEMA